MVVLVVGVVGGSGDGSGVLMVESDCKLLVVLGHWQLYTREYIPVFFVEEKNGIRRKNENTKKHF